MHWDADRQRKQPLSGGGPATWLELTVEQMATKSISIEIPGEEEAQKIHFITKIKSKERENYTQINVKKGEGQRPCCINALTCQGES